MSLSLPFRGTHLILPFFVVVFTISFVSLKIVSRLLVDSQTTLESHRGRHRSRSSTEWSGSKLLCTELDFNVRALTLRWVLPLGCLGTWEWAFSFRSVVSPCSSSGFEVDFWGTWAVCFLNLYWCLSSVCFNKFGLKICLLRVLISPSQYKCIFFVFLFFLIVIIILL